MKNSPEMFKGRFQQTEESVNFSERTMEIIVSKKQKLKKKKKMKEMGTEPKGPVGHNQGDQHAHDQIS